VPDPCRRGGFGGRGRTPFVPCVPLVAIDDADRSDCTDEAEGDVGEITFIFNDGGALACATLVALAWLALLPLLPNALLKIGERGFVAEKFMAEAEAGMLSAEISRGLGFSNSMDLLDFNVGVVPFDDGMTPRCDRVP
jgi:hypothetical protein